MARPTKQGIDFFSLDVHDDDKLDLFIAEAGAEGYGILIMLWKLIYRGQGYYIDDNEDLVLLLRKRTFSAPETIENVIKTALKRGIFSEKLHTEHKILTSTGIQKRFFPAARKKKEVHVRPEFLLISVSDYKNIVSGSGNLIAGSGNATKEKEKEKEKEEREYSGSLVRDARTREAELPSQQEVVEFFSAAGLTIYQAEQYHLHLNRDGPSPTDWRAAAMVWAADNINKHKRTNHAGNTTKPKHKGDPHAIANWQFIKACEQHRAGAGEIDPCEQGDPGG